jgi:hypothetical protein
MRIQLRDGRWVVLALWLGQERVVYSSENIFACIRFVYNERGNVV